MKKNFGIPYEIYQAISEKASDYGIFHKCLFHLHTPASHDYRYFREYESVESKQFNPKKIQSEVTDIVLFNKCVKLGILPSNQREEFFLQHGKDNVFSNEREFWAYMLIAAIIHRSNMELVVISDHNTIEGYDKLCRSIKILYDMNYLEHRTNGFYPTLILGIELSCADKNHVVAIFDDVNEQIKDESKQKIQQFLKDFLMNEEDGLYITSNEVLDKIFDMDGIAYIAHVNSSNMFSGEKFLSGAYKKKLMQNPNFRIAGIKKITDESYYRGRLEEETKREFALLLESDAHNVDEIPDTFFWIKGYKCNFDMIRSALIDSRMAISLEKPKSPSILIKGLLIRGENGFLNDGDAEKDFVITFSEALNCFIGGRGTGKSTLLSIIELVLSQRFNSLEMYEAISAYTEIWLSCAFNKGEYLIQFAPPQQMYETDDAKTTLIEWLKIECRHKIKSPDILKKLMYDNDAPTKNEIRRIFLDKSITVYQKANSGDFKKLSRQKTVDILKKIFGNGYVVNELVRIAGTREISNYIMETMEIEKLLRKDMPNFSPDTSSSKKVLEFLNEHSQILSTRKKFIEEYLSQFNNQTSQRNKLRIRYEQKENLNNFIDFEEILANSKKFQRSLGGSVRYFSNYNITIDGVIGFLNKCWKKSTIAFLRLMLHRLYEDIGKIASIESFCEQFSQKMTDYGFMDVKDDPKAVIRLIVEEVLRLGKDNIIKKFPAEYLQAVERFVLEFNIESKSTSAKNKKPNFLEIGKLSQGQKVVAMLSFILGYSAYIEDERPFVIDQPEDNLDNQYIYETLVKMIRDVKLKKQIIMATHNATIVTNARAEQVIVLESDGKNGKVLASGYSDEKRIKRHIINYLEGGIEAFRKKYQIYGEILANS